MKIIISIITLILLNTASVFSQKLVQKYYDLGQTKLMEKYYVNSKNQKNGSYIKYDERGLKAIEANFVNGRPHGLGKEYDLPLYGYPGDEKLRQTVNYVNGEMHGKETNYAYLKDGKESLKEGKQTKISEIYWEHDKRAREVYFYENGKVAKDYYTNNGYEKEWYKNGQLALEGIIVDGRDNGIRKEWYENGQIAIDGTKKDGSWYGVKKAYYPNGKLKSEENYTDRDHYGPVLKGEQFYYDSIGNLTDILTYKEKNGKKQEVHYVNYYPNGGGKEKEYTHMITYLVADKPGNVEYINSYTSYHPNGKKEIEGKLTKDGKRDGIWEVFNENGEKISDLKFENGSRSGKWTMYFDSNSNEVFNKDKAIAYREIEFSNTGAIIDNETTDYYFDGNKLRFKGKLIRVDPDAMDGKFVYYYSNGNIQYQGEEKMGKSVGFHKVFYENGNLRLEGEYDPYGDENRTGTWFTYNEDGSLKNIKKFNNDNLKEEIDGDSPEALSLLINLKKERLTKKIEENKSEIDELYYTIKEALGQSIKIKVKGNIYDAYIILQDYYSNNIKLINNSEDIQRYDSKLDKLLSKMKSLINEDTKQLEKDLKKVKDPIQIENILNIN